MTSHRRGDAHEFSRRWIQNFRRGQSLSDSLRRQNPSTGKRDLHFSSLSLRWVTRLMGWRSFPFWQFEHGSASRRMRQLSRPLVHNVGQEPQRRIWIPLLNDAFQFLNLGMERRGSFLSEGLLEQWMHNRA
jgi:hypothetical protein